MYVEAYETSSKRSIFSNNAFVRNVHHRSLRVIFSWIITSFTLRVEFKVLKLRKLYNKCE